MILWAVEFLGAIQRILIAKNLKITPFQCMEVLESGTLLVYEESYQVKLLCGDRTQQINHLIFTRTHNNQCVYPTPVALGHYRRMSFREEVLIIVTAADC